MNQLLTLAYAVGGGVVGAGLNQYVTNIGQRRTARATVVEKSAETEGIYTRMRWPESRPLEINAVTKLHREMERSLHALEAAGLIAGISRGTLSMYTTACRMLDAYITFRASLTRLDLELEVNSKAKIKECLDKGGDNLSEDARAAIAALQPRIESTLEGTPEILERLKVMEKEGFKLHDRSLNALSDALWHPIMSKVKWRKNQKIREFSERVEAMHRDLYSHAQEGQALKDKLAMMVDKLVHLVLG